MLIFNALQVVRVTQGAKLFKVVIARPRQSSPPYCHCEDEARGRSNLLISTVIARTRYEDEAIYQSNDCPIIPTEDCFVTLKQHPSLQELNHFPFLAKTVPNGKGRGTRTKQSTHLYCHCEDEVRGRSNLPIE